MRRLLLVLVVLAPALALADEEELRALADRVGLDDAYGFAATVTTLRETGELPDYYLTKDEARDLGWHPGSDLCEVAQGAVIGGDRFGNREGLLPEARGRTWQEADLDFDCGRRGADRLVWSSDGLIFVTTDHYESFSPVPE